MSLISFMLEFARNPRNIGGIIPSSGALSDAIKDVVAERMSASGVLVEVGAGTGAITAALRELAHPLIAIEPNDRFREHLQKKYPDLRVIPSFLQQAEPEINDYIGERPAVLVSSLPMLSLSLDIRREVQGVFLRFLRRKGGATIVQYTYKSGDPIGFVERGINAQCVKSVRMNFPPAHIWTYQYIRSNESVAT